MCSSSPPRPRGGTCACMRDLNLCCCSFCPFGCWCWQFGLNAERMHEGTRRKCCCFYMWGYCLCLGIPSIIFATAMRERLQKRAGLPSTDGWWRNFACVLLCPWCSIAEEARVMMEIAEMRREEEMEEDSLREVEEVGRQRPVTPSEQTMSQNSGNDDDPYNDFG